jgi:hypothetical protein
MLPAGKKWKWKNGKISMLEDKYAGAENISIRGWKNCNDQR